MTTTVPFKPVRTPRMSLAIVKQIQEAIFRGDYQPGQRLPTERDLVQMFGVSKVTVREALRILETYGLITVRPGASGGAFVNVMTPHPVSNAAYNMLQLEGFCVTDVYQARLLFEPPVAELAAKTADETDWRRLEESIDRTRALVAAGKKTIAESQQFHLTLIAAAKNPVIELILSSLLDLVRLAGAIVPANDEISQMVVFDHEEILEAMRRRDGAAARALMAEHLRKLVERFSRIEQQLDAEDR